jgi:hypothetical protein
MPAGCRAIMPMVQWAAIRYSMIPKSGYRFSEKITLKEYSMIPKSGYRFSEKIMPKHNLRPMEPPP